MPFSDPKFRQEYMKRWRETHKDKIRAYNNSDKVKLYKYNYNRSEKMAAYREKYNKENSQRFREARRARRDATYAGMGGKCITCGFSDYRALQIDHINGDGKSERRLLRKDDYYPNVLKSFLAGEKRYQLLCCNCNWIKREENGEFRKKSGKISH